MRQTEGGQRSLGRHLALTNDDLGARQQSLLRLYVVRRQRHVGARRHGNRVLSRRIYKDQRHTRRLAGITP